MSLRLRDLIRQVRACKTAAEERAVIAKESAMIRTAIREEQVHYRHRNVAKLLYMHMLGYPTHFGQLECMKLIASPHFPEKRIGYLGMMLLLSEEADVLMLATNALKNDLNNENRFVAGLALCAIGNLATADMSRDLVPEVDKHFKSHQPYLRKKACLAMARCLTKCPDMVEDFVERVVSLLKDKSHGVLITVVQLMTQVLIMEEKHNLEEGADSTEGSPCRDAFLKLVPSLVKLLRNLLGSGYSPDHDVGGISDPFLQVQILTLFRLLGTGDAAASEEMNDVLAQVATNTESAKNAGNAILYECVQTVMAIESDDGLRVLAVNILGRFLLNRDNNIRYVALNTLSKCIADQKEVSREDSSTAEGQNSASSALQRHRTTIVDCLKDPDISIRQRALELIYHLVNSENVEGLTAELLNYLVLCPREHRADICTRVLRVVDKYSPDDRWRVDTLITMLTIAGRECTRNVQSSTIVYISRSSEDLRSYCVHKLLKAIRDDDGSQRGLLLVGIWCIGEYGDLLMNPYTFTPSPKSTVETDSGDAAAAAAAVEPVTISFMGLDPASVVKTIEDVVNRHSCAEEVKERALTCFTKLSDRFATVADADTLEKLHKLVKKYKKSHALELQLRSCEYDALLNAAKGLSVANGTTNDDLFGPANGGESNNGIKTAARDSLARMPVVDLNVMKRRRASAVAGLSDDGDDDNGAVASSSTNVKPEGDLLDLADIFGGPPQASAVTVQQNGSKPSMEESTSNANLGGKSDLDLLSDIFSAPPVNALPVAPSAGYDLFSSMPAQQPSSSAGDMFASMPAPSSSAGDMFSSMPTPAANIGAFTSDPFASSSTSQQLAPVLNPTPALSSNPVLSSVSVSVPVPVPAAVSAEPEKKPYIVPAFSHGGLSVQFECSKPDLWNKQISTVVAKFTNTTDAPIHGLSMQCAVPKYITMEIKPPTSTTVPVSGGINPKQVTQTINVTNTMLGTKNLMLKLKVGFTSKGTKVEHLATCSGFPAGQF